MRFLIISDVHANLEAFEAVMAVVSADAIDRCLFLGDIVGYGASPNEVIDRLKALQPNAVVRGNHDKVIAGIEEGHDFQAQARESAMWARAHLRPENVEYLRKMPKGPMTVDEAVQISHGSPHDEDFYILSEVAAIYILEGCRHWLTFFGHTHVPMVYSMGGQFECRYPKDDDCRYLLSDDRRYLINPGAVGQPRDLNPKASFAILDTDERAIRIQRVSYDIAAAQRRIRKAGLPKWHAERLAIGR